MVAKLKPFGVIIGLLFAAFPAAAFEASESAKPGILFKGTSIPKPPKQGEPWKPLDTRLPEKWITAAEELYRKGFADPRGCEYRKVKLSCGSSLWGGSYLVTAHAWVLPEDSEARPGGQRFAVTWTGIVYPVFEVGPTANLADDVESLIKKFQAAQKDVIHTGHMFAQGHPEFAEGTMRLPPESRLVSYDQMFALKSCLLLRLGESDLAAKVWDNWVAANPALMSEAQSPAGDPYMVFALEWGWALFDHAITAHMQGDDVVSLDAAKTLVRFKESVPRVAANRGIDQRKSRADNAKLDFLPIYDPPETLVEDSARRVKAGPVRRALDVGLDKLPDQSQRIAALVRDLEVVCAGPEYEEGDVPLAPPFITYGRPPVNPFPTSPIVKALIKEGEPAVEPLLECLIDDRRLTRVAGAGHHEISGDLLPPRDLITVDVAAYWALCGILKAEHFGPLTEEPYYNSKNREERRAVAEEIRRRFNRIKGLTPEESCMSVLADPNLTCQSWFEAAERIVAPAGQKPPDARQRYFHDRSQPAENGGPMAGEALRKKQSPSVSELLAKRCDDSANQGADWQLSADLTLCLVRWDPKAAIPVLDRRIAEWRAGFGDHIYSYSIEPFIALVEAALLSGNDKAAQEYAAWLKSTPPDRFDFFEQSIFMPLCRHPDNPKLVELARWLFLADDSPWNPNQKSKPIKSAEMICSPLVGVPAFRELLKRELANVKEIGEFEFLPTDVSIELRNAGWGISMDYAADVETSKVKGKQPLRARDFYALEISRLEGAPRYELYWPEERRKEVRKQISVFLDQWGNCFRDRDKSFGSRYDSFRTARFSISPLAQPATAADVSAGHATFSLLDHDGNQVRVVPLKPYPHIARWKTLKKFPFRTPGAMEWPKDRSSRGQKVWESLPKELYDREGLVWQAEEVLRDGKWQRYYGFVGNHVIAKVPAEEIELLDEYSPAHPQRW
jgi:hypothetical protein